MFDLQQAYQIFENRQILLDEKVFFRYTNSTKVKINHKNHVPGSDTRKEYSYLRHLAGRAGGDRGFFGCALWAKVFSSNRPD